jgi:hypothetical protein
MSAVQVHQQAITQEQVNAFAAAWFRALDNHEPIEACYKLLAEDGLRMQFPDGDIHDQASFKKWYDRVTNLFFDENHNVVSAQAQITGDHAVVDVVVAWQASWWEAPAAKSKRTAMDATQRWTVRRTDRNPYGLEITSYNATVEPFKYAAGFARL